MSNQIKYRDLTGYKYQLAEDYEIGISGAFGQVRERSVMMHPAKRPMIRLTRLVGNPGCSLLWISAGYSWDGPSGPTIDTPNFMRGSLVHDALYQLIRERLIPVAFKDEADQVLRKICLQDGMSALRAWIVYQGVKRFAGFATANRDREPIEIIRIAP